MSRTKEPLNPFNFLCAVLGVVFTVTACAYGLYMLRTTRGLGTGVADAEQGEHPLMSLMDRYGIMVLGIELALLIAVSLAAILLDHYRGKRINSERKL
jgi:hypothetical protein